MGPLVPVDSVWQTESAMATFLRQSIDPASRVFRGCAAVALLAFIVLAGGIPIPAGNYVVRQADEFYPCMHNGCGCATATDCWQSCCCYSLSERLAWARKHDVRPPKFAMDKARRLGLALSDGDRNRAGLRLGLRAVLPTQCLAACSTMRKRRTRKRRTAARRRREKTPPVPSSHSPRWNFPPLGASSTRVASQQLIATPSCFSTPSAVVASARTGTAWQWRRRHLRLFDARRMSRGTSCSASLLNDYQPAHHQPPAPPPRYALLCG